MSNNSEHQFIYTVMSPTGEVEQPAKDVEEEYEYRRFRWQDLFTKDKIFWWVIAIVFGVLAVLMVIYHNRIVTALQPISLKIRELKWGFVIPVVIFIIISFPPLFGHEIVGILCGVVYGLWIGFAIVAAGTFLGESANWFAFKYAFRRKAVKLERTNLTYGSLARLTREGGFLIIFIIRFSALPSHISTAVFSTCNVNFWLFELATFLTLPKQITIVYFGVLLGQANNSNVAKDIVLAISILVTIVAGAYIYFRMSKVKKVLLEEQAARLLDKHDGHSHFHPGVASAESFDWVQLDNTASANPVHAREQV